MKILDIRTIEGPNVYGYRSMLAATVDLGPLAETRSCDLPAFIDRLLTTLPGLWEHHCGLGRRGGFVERLHTGTYLAHVMEHVALELTDAAGISVNRGKTIQLDTPGHYRVFVAYQSEPGMTRLLHVAAELVDALVQGRDYPLDDRVAEARTIVDTHQLGPSTQAIVRAAEQRGIPWKRVSDDSLIRFGYGAAIRHVQATTTDRTSSIAVDLAGNKELTKQVLRAAGIPVPRGCVVDTRDEAIACLRRLVTPLVIKPLDGNQGRGVSLNLTTEAEVAEAFELAAAISPRVIVEELYRGNDYRVVLVDGRIVAAAQRIPAHVWGDGVHTIAQLIEKTNDDPRRGDGHEKPLTKITPDPILLVLLKRAGRQLEDVPASGQMILLRESANLSTGGEARDVTDRVHPSIRSICERAARLIGLDICGVDLVLPAIDQPLNELGGIVEVNAGPGIRMHHHPSEGAPRDVGGAIVDMLYPPGTSSRIPVISITGTNGKTTVTRLIAHVVASTGKRVGMTTTDGIWIDGTNVMTGDTTGPRSAAVVLGDPAVEVAVLETARGGIVRSGLGYDWADIGVMTNIQADHIGQDGIETVDDILHIKQLVAERVREGGTLVLNADDERLAVLPAQPLMQDIARRIVYFSLDPHNPHLADHLSQGGTALVANDGWIEERTGDTVTRLGMISSIPATLGGTAGFQIANVLAAIAAARAFGMDGASIIEALGTFALDRQSMGRLNLFAVNGGVIMLDYGHNPAAIDAVCQMVATWGASRVTQVITAPGDRADQLIEAVGRAVHSADRVIVREDDDRRGRAPGSVAELIAHVVRSEQPGVEVRVILDEIEAMATAVAEMQPGEVVVVFADRLEQVTAWLREHGAEPLSGLPRFGALGDIAPRPAA